MVTRMRPSLVVVLLALALPVYGQDLQWEYIQFYPEALSVTAQCNPNGTATVSFSVACSVNNGTCTMEGPYVGSYTESGTITLGKNGVKSFKSSFTVSGATGTATGTSNGVLQQDSGPEFNYCIVWTGQDTPPQYNRQGIEVLIYNLPKHSAKTPTGTDGGDGHIDFDYWDFTWQEEPNGGVVHHEVGSGGGHRAFYP
jgi:hypothetical protein